MYRRFVKRLIDLIGVFAGLILTSPIWIWLIPALAINNRGKVFFIQQRTGKNGKLFRLVKFRTMTDERDENGVLLPDEKRLTKFGNFVRSMSFDELPQIYNILRGDMSLIGPRPLLPEYLPLYSERQSHRHEIRPGITGWAQCHGRNALSWNEKFELDVWYVDHISLATDARIFFMTARNVFARKDVTPINGYEMERFNGKN